MRLLNVTITAKIPLSKEDETYLRRAEARDVISTLRAAGAEITVVVKRQAPVKPKSKVASAPTKQSFDDVDGGLLD